MKKRVLALLVLAACLPGQVRWNQIRQSDKDAGLDAKFLDKGGAVHNSKVYDFSAQRPDGTLTASVPATVTLTPCPLGVAGANANHYLYISGGVGTAEAVLITGGTCTSGAASGTIQFTPAYNHTGAWQIASATAGIQEALRGGMSNGTVRVHVPPGSLTMYGRLYVPPGQGLSLTVDANLIWPSTVGANNGTWIDSCEGCSFRFNGLIQYNGTGYAVFLSPVTVGIAGYRAIQWCDFHWSNISSFQGDGPPGGPVPLEIATANLHLRVLGGATDGVRDGLISHNKFTILGLWGAKRAISISHDHSIVPHASMEESIWEIGQVVKFTEVGIETCDATQDPTDFVCPNHVWDIGVIWPKNVAGPPKGLYVGKQSNATIMRVANTSQIAVGDDALTLGPGSNYNHIIYGKSATSNFVDNSGGSNIVIDLTGGASQIGPTWMGKFGMGRPLTNVFSGVYAAPQLLISQSSAETVPVSSNGPLVLLNPNTTTSNLASIQFGSVGTNSNLYTNAQIAALFGVRGTTYHATDLLFLTGIAGEGPTERMRLLSTGVFGVGTPTPTNSGTGKQHVAGNTARPFDTTRTPAGATEACNAGEVAFDASYIYICVAADTWKRAGLASW